ncbi:MAG TPA: isochorismatase family protein [Acidimicrobiales bacterium]|jgi:nicotinamidase/pyrazinamidase|nr:isochorismatase family protein [Acidimicrobiales bacterium]
MPDATRYDERTALIVVDVQNDFADPDGSLYVRDGERVVPVINREIQRARAAGALVVYTRDWHPPRTPHFKPFGGVWPVHCVRDTWGAAFHPGLDVDGVQIQKAVGDEDGYSGFSVTDLPSGERRSTPLEAILRQHDIARAVVVGLATDYCVKDTALDAQRLGFDTVVLRDAVRAVDLAAGDGARALDELTAAGVAVT